jgi:glycosyltransferase involved in cell wall biosynthesis
MLPESSPKPTDSLLVRGIRAWRVRGFSALVQRTKWKTGRWLFAPQPNSEPGHPHDRVRLGLQTTVLAVWKDLPVDSFAPEKRLAAIVAAHPDAAANIVFAPSIGWSTNLFQRPQQLARALANQNCLVFYAELFNPQLETGIHQLGEQLYDCNVPADCFRVLAKPAVVAHTYNRYYLSNFQSPLVIYDYLDDLQVHAGDPRQVTQDHIELTRSADIVLATSESLLEQVSPLRADAILCPNGVDYEYFHQDAAASLPMPRDLTLMFEQGKPIVLYYGALARWFDYELLYSAAQMRPELSFVLIGNDYDGSLPASAVLALPNVHWLGIRPYAQLPAYLRYCAVTMIPFKLTSITHATSPIKLFEYFAAGKPVVTTRMRECLRYPGVLAADGPGEFSSQLDQALRLRDDSSYLEMIDRVAIENTWEARAHQILGALRAKYA